MDAKEYFENYTVDESLVIKYKYDERSGQVIVVIDLADRALSMSAYKGSRTIVRELHQICFFGVSSYNRDMVGKLFQSSYDYDASENSASICMYAVANKTSENGYKFKASFGAFGYIYFSYESLSCDVMELVPDKSNKGIQIYRNIGTGHIVDFYNPFGD